MSATKDTGNLGESLAAKYLRSCDYKVLERNYTKPYGEIDIIAKKGEAIHFVEVKTVTHETVRQLQWAVTNDTWRPEEQVHRFKLRQISKAVDTWLSENRYTGNWQIDVLALRIVPRETYCSVNYIQNITEIDTVQ